MEISKQPEKCFFFSDKFHIDLGHLYVFSDTKNKFMNLGILSLLWRFFYVTMFVIAFLRKKNKFELFWLLNTGTWIGISEKKTVLPKF